MFTGILEHELTDERWAVRLAAAYDDGAYKAVERIFERLFGGRHYPGRVACSWQTEHALRDTLMPDYCELRDFLLYEHSVPLVLAARVAFRLTRFQGSKR